MGGGWWVSMLVCDGGMGVDVGVCVSVVCVCVCVDAGIGVLGGLSPHTLTHTIVWFSYTASPLGAMGQEGPQWHAPRALQS